MKYRKKLENKKYAQRVHFKKRFYQRTGLKCNKELYYNLIKNKGVFLYRESNRVNWYHKQINSKDYILVYDRARKNMVTIIPENYFTEFQKDLIKEVKNNGKK